MAEQRIVKQKQSNRTKLRKLKKNYKGCSIAKCILDWWSIAEQKYNYVGYFYVKLTQIWTNYSDIRLLLKQSFVIRSFGVFVKLGSYNRITTPLEWN